MSQQNQPILAPAGGHPSGEASAWQTAARGMLLSTLKLQVEQLRTLAKLTDAQILARGIELDENKVSFCNALRKLAAAIPDHKFGVLSQFDPLCNFDRAATMIETLAGTRAELLESQARGLETMLAAVENAPAADAQSLFDQLAPVVDAIPLAARL